MEVHCARALGPYVVRTCTLDRSWRLNAEKNNTRTSLLASICEIALLSPHGDGLKYRTNHLADDLLKIKNVRCSGCLSTLTISVLSSMKCLLTKIDINDVHEKCQSILNNKDQEPLFGWECPKCWTQLDNFGGERMILGKTHDLVKNV